MRASFIGRRIVVFTAHPDDEVLAAGTMYANHKAGGKTFLLCATDGEKGRSHLKSAVPSAALKRIRRAELLKAARVLKVDKVISFGFPDTGVRENEVKLFKKSFPAVEKLSPDYILSFGPDGISGHWDHIVAGRVAKKIAKKLKVPFAAFTFAPAAAARPRREHFLKRRKFGKYAGVPRHRTPNLRVKVNTAVKNRALRNHKSQFGNRPPFADLPESVRKRLFAHEHFVDEGIL